jgi:cobalt/nickel transport system permease protein
LHVPDGFLSPQLTLPALVVAVPLAAWAARRRFGPSSVEALPILGTLTALAFVIQTIMVPVPGGTSTHLVGATLLALLYGPLTAFACEALVLVLQALFFGAGGVTVLGVNALALGLVGPLAGWLVWKTLRRLAGERAAAFLAAWVAMQASTAAVVGVLWLQHVLDPGYLPMEPAVMAGAMFLPSLTVAGLLEGGYTLLALSLLRKANLRGLDRSST